MPRAAEHHRDGSSLVARVVVADVVVVAAVHAYAPQPPSLVHEHLDAHAWGGEPEILSLARVLGVRIEVFVDERQRLRSIGVYGGDDDDVCDDDERDETRPVAVVFRGAGHYEALARCDE